MANALDFSGFIIAAVEAARRYDADPLRTARYEFVLLDLAAATKQREGSLTLGAIEEIFAKYALPTAHLTQILKGL
ncbi:MAG: hypothetical protein WDN29_16465 [Methylovirgula sp.]